MKTLVIQLARLGDILQTLPVLNSYCRQNKNEEVHFLVRKKFSEIATLLPVAHKIIEMDTSQFLGDMVINGSVGCSTGTHILGEWIEKLKKEGYSKIINLSFSPYSSYLTFLLSKKDTKIFGYTRHEDGFLSIPDDPSAYFYGQVGINRANRFHLIDLFAAVMGTDMQSEDWNISLPPSKWASSSKFIALHIGASNPKKALHAKQIVKLIVQLNKRLNHDIYLLGAKDDLVIAETILQGVQSSKVKNLVGKTNLTDLIQVIAKADLFLGADSGPLQICNLTDTTCVNFSNNFVNFWETGPRTTKSYICFAKDFNLLDMEEVANEITSIVSGKASQWITGDRMGFYGSVPTNESLEFQWALIKALYLSEPFPKMQSSKFATAIVHLNDVNSISLHHLSNFQIGNKQQSQVLETADQIMDSIAAEVEEIMPLIYWFRTEKIRLGPMPLADLILRYSDLHKKLKQVLDIYLSPKWSIQEDIYE